MKPSEKLNRKFIESFEVNDWSVLTDTGWEPITHTNKTIEYNVWKLETEDGTVLECADNHIVFDSQYREVFVKDLKIGDKIISRNGIEIVLSVINTGRKEYMYDLTVGSTNHRYYTNGILSHNTQVIAAVILHFVLFNSDKLVAILANKHAQAKEIVHRIRQMYEYLPFFMQQGAVIYNRQNIEFENGSGLFCAATGNDGIRGKSCSVIYIDEAAFISNDNEFYESTYPVISSGEETKIVMTSTPKGRRGMFFNIFEGSDIDPKQSKNGYKRLHFTWRDDKRKGEEWKERTIKEFGITRFMQEFDVIFRGSSGTLISPVILQDLTFSNPLNEGEDENLFIYENYDKNNPQQYVAFVDTAEGLGKDYSVITVINVSSIPHKVACIYRSNTISPILFPHTIISVCKAYGECPVLIESNNSSGGQVSYITYNELQYEGVILTSNNNLATSHAEFGNNLKPGVRTTRKTKSLGCSNLNTIIENNNLVINDSNALEELGTFILKGTSYEADKDCTDDIVMTLVIYAWYMTQDTFKEYSGTNLSEHIYMQQVKEAMDHVMPFGFILENSEYRSTNPRIATVTNVHDLDEWMCS